jgi:hypothetical protein
MAARSLRRGAALAAFVCVAGFAHASMDTASRLDEVGDVLVPHPSQARYATLGFDALASDYYWLQAVQVLGGARADIGGKYELVARLMDVVTTLDPWVGHPYRFAAVWLTDSQQSVRAANRLLERGIAYHPDDWRNRHYLGFNRFFYLGDVEAAADVLEAAVGMPRAPRYLGALVAKLRAGRDGLETSAGFLASLAANTEDHYARAEYLKALDEVETERRARVLDQAREEYRQRNGRDIERVADLLRGSPPLLKTLPPAHPQLPQFRWAVDPESGEIVSSYYRRRYELQIHALDRERRERERRQSEREG